jgi:nucleoside 2-deoxyribosyltransferase
MKKLKIYLASPYTKGDVGINVKNSFEAYDVLLKNNFLPFAPLTSHFIHMMYPQDYNTWLEIDLEWLKVCDAVLRLPGESRGADIEVEYAEKNNIPVFYNYSDLMRWNAQREYASLQK